MKLEVNVIPHSAIEFCVTIRIDGKIIITKICKDYQDTDQAIPALKEAAIRQYNLAKDLEKKHG